MYLLKLKERKKGRNWSDIKNNSYKQDFNYLLSTRQPIIDYLFNKGKI